MTLTPTGPVVPDGYVGESQLGTHSHLNRLEGKTNKQNLNKAKTGRGGTAGVPGADTRREVEKIGPAKALFFTQVENIHETDHRRTLV